eukprot:EST42276.1 Hypothetical protein SS50377_18143 [Spironucleus salmonicida]
MWADTPEDIQKCFADQFKKGKICIFNNKIPPQKSLEICQTWLTQRELSVRQKYAISGILATGRTQLVFRVARDPNVVSFPAQRGISAVKPNVIFVLGDAKGLVSVTEERALRALFTCRKSVAVQVICGAGSGRRLHAELADLANRFSVQMGRYVTLRSVGFQGTSMIVFRLEIDPQIRVLRQNRGVVKGGKYLMRMVGADYRQVLGAQRQIKWVQHGEFCLFEVLA